MSRLGPASHPLQLHPRERQRLRQLSSHADGRVVRRAQALLWLAAGESVANVAQRLHCSRQTLYDLLARYRARRDQPILERLQDVARPGRPQTARELATQTVQELLPRAPADFGYRAQNWTVAMLQTQLQQRHGTWVSEDTLARALHDAGYCYKRPRYVLARRAPHWRQAKGGSNEGSKAATAPCSCS